ncbi:MAG TPA: cytochrome c biogenesis protein CcsA [Spongiibacteraceae bacterium]|jgi:ABC-type uncharacterized transport system permease subunit|nr:cytochrome c biogenesis protein CcsA [Spongiibacteraceae bacterium]HUH37128.1 cytochrome c biogenesis protein CcsA [Spongiibacteraceae bacterium]
MIQLASAIAISLYLLAAVLEARQLRGAVALRSRLPVGLAAVAALIHAYCAYAGIRTEHGIDLGFFPVSSLIAWIVVTLTLLGSLRRPLQSLLVVLLPLAALAIAVPLGVSGPGHKLHSMSDGVLAHILLSILAYSVLAIAALQAGALAIQERQLKTRQVRGLIQMLPPLQTMEALLFEIIWVGVILLALAILTGFAFVDNLFAQHLVHKTVLSIIAWVIFALLLWGRHRWGWRGHTAIRWTAGGFAVLVLAYFGTKLVLELILQRG